MPAEDVPAAPTYLCRSPRSNTISRKGLIVPQGSGTSLRSSPSSHSTSITSQISYVQIRIPSVPTYTPNVRLPQRLVDQKIAALTVPNDRRNGAVVSRFTTEDGWIRFTVRTGSTIDEAHFADTNEVEVDLADIYDYVTPAELERYEHHELELEAEREADRPKVGRPCKKSPGFTVSTQVMGQEIRMKKPLGRPRKHPVASHQNTRTNLTKQKHKPGLAFAGVHIPSPIKASQRSYMNTSNSTSASGSTSTTSTDSVAKDNLYADYRDQGPTPRRNATSKTQDPSINVDQLTPSNARRVISAPQPSPKRRSHRPSYSMMKVALSDTGMEDDLPQSPSEDELSTQFLTFEQRRFSAVAEIADSVTSEVEEPIYISSSSSSRDAQDSQPPSRQGDEDIDMLFNDHKAAHDRSTGHQQLLQQFQANNARRLPSKELVSTDSTPSAVSPTSHHAKQPVTEPKQPPYQRLSMAHSPIIHAQTTPTHPSQIRKSMTPHFPTAIKSNRKTSEPRVPGGKMDGNVGTPTKHRSWRNQPAVSRTNYTRDDLHYKPSLLEKPVKSPVMFANDNKVTLGSPEILSSDEDGKINRHRIHPFNRTYSANLCSLEEAPQITLGSPLRSSSDEVNHKQDTVDHTTRSGEQSNAGESESNGGGLSGSSSITSRLFSGMPWR
ncbi:MAG: hypothetical protein Q9209_005455 [Squamulea sp. 1 TL-2023]